jgi:hypothetical protein
LPLPLFCLCSASVRFRSQIRFLKNATAYAAALPTADARRAALNSIVSRTDPGPGGFYDDLGGVPRSTRLSVGFGPDSDPQFLYAPLVAYVTPRIHVCMRSRNWLYMSPLFAHCACERATSCAQHHSCLQIENNTVGALCLCLHLLAIVLSLPHTLTRFAERACCALLECASDEPHRWFRLTVWFILTVWFARTRTKKRLHLQERIHFHSS